MRDSDYLWLEHMWQYNGQENRKPSNDRRSLAQVSVVIVTSPSGLDLTVDSFPTTDR